MANQLYGYRPTSTYLTGANSRSTVSDYISGDGIASRYLSGDLLASSSSVLYDPHNYSIAPTHSYRPPGVDVGSDLASSTDPLYAALKRNSSDSLYHQTLLGAYNKIGQTEAWHPTDPLAKRTRYESTSLLPTYPQRPGEKGCAFYMQTRTCKFGESCKFDHPIWVPEGGFPDWKEVPPVSSEYLPERPGEPDCPYFLKTQKCKFGVRCKFNHPKDKIEPPGASVVSDASSLPERPSEPPCAFYMKTGKCKYGANCKFHHPKGVQVQLAGGESELQTKPIGGTITKTAQPSITPVLSYNTKGLPIRTGEEDCPFYLKTGSCKYGVTCRFSHPERYASAIGSSTLSAYFNLGVASSAASLLSTYDPRPSQTTIGVGANVYPQRPGQTECDYYMKNGICKFGDNCKFHHPIDRSAHTSSTKDAHPQQQNVKLTLAGLPRREGAIHCPYYMKTGTCKFGSTCKFDHPPPAEAMALAAAANSNIATVEGDQQNVPDAS